MKVALIHDHLTQHGGAENVLLALQEIWPEAPTYTLVYDTKRAHPAFATRDICTSWLQKFPGARRHYQWYLPLMPTATESYDLREYDVVISSSSAFAKGALTHHGQLHICYCHTPTRYLWTDSHSYVHELRYPFFVKMLIPPLLTRLRVWDRVASERPDQFIANSYLVARRIKKFYTRDSTVIYPPVEVERFGREVEGDGGFGGDDKKRGSGDYFLIGGRLVYYKRFDIAIRAFNKLGIKLKVFGTGPELARLRTMAKPKNIEFLGHVSEAEKIELYQNCRAFLHPHVEDFGITAVEANAAGRPVVAYRAGGAVETVAEGVTGVFFDDQDWEALADTIIRTDWSVFDSAAIKTQAKKFGKERFKRETREYVEGEWDRFKSKNEK